MYIQMHLHNNESKEKEEDLASDDMVEDPDDPKRAGALSKVIYPDSDSAEGAV